MTRQEKLNQKIPRELIKSRSAGGGRSLDYINTFYCISTLNEIFEQGGWGYDIPEGYPKCVGEETLSVRGKEKKVVSYISKIEFHATIKPYMDKDGNEEDNRYSGRGRTARFTEVGFGNGSDPFSMGAAHELASKEAVTDALKRAAKNLGYRMGLALYDKDQQFVEDTPAPTPTNGKATLTSSDAMALITAKSKVIIKKELKTADELRKFLTDTYKVSKKEELTLPQATQLLTQLDNVLNTGTGR